MKSTLLNFSDPISPPGYFAPRPYADRPAVMAVSAQSTVCGRPSQASNNFRLNARVAVSEGALSRSCSTDRPRADGITTVIDGTVIAGAGAVSQRSFIIFATWQNLLDRNRWQLCNLQVGSLKHKFNFIMTTGYISLLHVWKNFSVYRVYLFEL